MGMSIDPLTWVVAILAAMVLMCCSHPPPDVYTGPRSDGRSVAWGRQGFAMPIRRGAALELPGLRGSVSDRPTSAAQTSWLALKRNAARSAFGPSMRGRWEICFPRKLFHPAPQRLTSQWTISEEFVEQ
jgi:hypothetical protein